MTMLGKVWHRPLRGIGFAFVRYGAKSFLLEDVVNKYRRIMEIYLFRLSSVPRMKLLRNRKFLHLNFKVSARTFAVLGHQFLMVKDPDHELPMASSRDDRRRHR